MKIVTVVPLKKGIFKSDLTYFTSKDIKNGNLVEIPIKNKKVLGLVIHSEDASNLKSSIKGMSFKLRKILAEKEKSVFRNEFLESALLFSSYSLAKKSNTITSLIPALFREKYDEIAKYKILNTTEEKQSFNPLQLISQNIKSEKLVFQANIEDRISYYKTLIRGQFASKKSVFIMLPTESDIEIFHQALSKGIENFTFIMHGGIKPKKIIESYKKIISLPHGVLILGTPQFLSLPRMDIGTIIIEQENSKAYKTIAKPHLDMRVFAEIYASRINAKLILGSTLLRYETIGRKETEMLGEVYPMSFRTNFKGEIKILNRERESLIEEKTKDTSVKKFKIFEEETLENIKETLEKKKNVFIYSLRKGLSTHTVCKDCGETISCDKCLAPVVLYTSKDGKKRMFLCNKCGTERNPETVCDNCGSWNLIPLGIGTETVYEEVKKKFPKARTFRIDKDSVKTETGAKKIIQEFKKTNGAILIGTEMAFFYLEDKTYLSVVASFDSLWSIPSFRMSERIVQIMFSLISKTERKILIQTKNKNDEALLAIKSENLLHLVRDELKDRKNLGYPPYKRFIKITYLGNKDKSLEAKKLLSEMLSDYNPEIFSGFIAKNKNQYVTNALIKLDPHEWSLPELLSNSSIDQTLHRLLSSLPFEYSIYVDPEDLL